MLCKNDCAGDSGGVSLNDSEWSRADLTSVVTIALDPFKGVPGFDPTAELEVRGT